MHWVVEGDLEDVFNNLEWIILRRSLEEKIYDPDLILLIHRFLRAGALQRQRPVAPALGVPQGAVFSPLFANIYLDRFDKVALRSGLKLVRYGDNIVVCCGSKGELRGGIDARQEITRQAGPRSESAQNSHFPAPQRGLAFLGRQLFLEAPEHGETRLASWSPPGESPIPAALLSPDSSKASDDDGAYVATGQNAARAEER